MYQVIARKYRPQTFGELIGQEHVRTTIENAILQRRIAHGYIFCGQRGTGKTTVARILARCLNCVEGPTPQPCGVCSSCLEVTAGNAPDVIEIDAASNRGINEMRELRENVRYRPARDRYKVFIIDEAHQITSEAFNALLKTLEEPPEWAVFILCTTEVHKIPTTIASRCQQFSFRSVDFGELVKRMEWICKEEGIQADPEALSVLAQSGEGSVRDSLSALDQAIACCGSTLSAAEVRGLLGMFSLDSLAEITKALSAADSRRMLEVVQELESNGRNLQHFCRELARYFRNLLVAKIAGGETRLIAASPSEQTKLAETGSGFSEEDLTRYLQLTLDLFKDMQFSPQPRLHLEVGLLRLVHAGKLLAIEEALANLGPGSGGEPVVTPAPPRPPKSSGASVFASAPTSPLKAPPPLPPPVAPPTVPPTAASAIPPTATLAPSDPQWKVRLHGALMEAGLAHTADAVEHSNVDVSATEIVFTTTKFYALGLKGDPDLPRIVEALAGRPLKLTAKVGEVTPTIPIEPASGGAKPTEDELSHRAFAHPEIQKFQETFPGSHVRMVRNLKD